MSERGQRLMARNSVLLCAIALVAAAMLGRAVEAGPAEAEPVIYSPRDASFLEMLAAREVRRYLYLRTGVLLPMEQTTGPLPANANGILVAQKDRPAVVGVLPSGDLRPSVSSLGEQDSLLKTINRDGRPLLLITGGSGPATLYGAYRFAELLGVRFYLHGDVIPDERIPFVLPDVEARARPLFPLRGIQPFHDFPEGPDWWSVDEYKAILAQLPKLGMNFFGLHTYPEGGPNAEPTVWIGMPGDVAEGSLVKFAYPASYQNTLRGNWGYEKKNTSEFTHGASQLFEHDAYGADVMIGHCPQPESLEDCARVFAETGDLLREAFTFARRLGIKTCVGAETPLTVPKRVQERLKVQGLDPADPKILQTIYEGIFTRIAKAYPIDYYWFWTPEGWTWSGVKEEQVRKTIADVEAAGAAARAVKAPFQLATCGWVLGPQYDRALFDKALPKEWPVSCINRRVGNEPVDPGFARVEGRPKWAIPWLEDDPGLSAPQLWVGRMRRDAADSLAYGCTGLMGIHWRTRILAPNVLALAKAAWDQREWNADVGARPETKPQVAGPEGGQHAAFPNNAIAGTEDDPLYQTVRYDVAAYRLPARAGTYKVTLKFCEPHYAEKGKRVFAVRVQGKPVVEHLDIFERVGRNRALDFTVANVDVAGPTLAIEFVPEVEFPSIAAIVVEGPGEVGQVGNLPGQVTNLPHFPDWKINCGGPAYRDYRADWPPSTPEPRYRPTGDFYRDWARAEFGPGVAEEAARIFERLDGKLPRPADWVNGPGGMNPDPRPWAEVAKDYTFVVDFAALQSRVLGAGNQERFRYWLDHFRYMRAMGELRCAWAAYNTIAEQLKTTTDTAARQALARREALPRRRDIVRLVAAVYEPLLASVSNTGELGTVANWEQHILPSLVGRPGEQLAQALGEGLPADAQLPTTYTGAPRLLVPTPRSIFSADEEARIRAIVLAKEPPLNVALFWRPLGTKTYTKTIFEHVARGVYTVKPPFVARDGADVEYYVETVTAGGETARFPATAPALNQTCIVVPGGE